MTISQNKPTIFISHSHTDNEFGIKLTRYLREALQDEQAAWYDIDGGLLGGDSWWRKIRKELTVREFFIVILSPESMQSRWVNLEIDIALNEGKRIIPLLHQECEVRVDLKTLQMISFLPPKEFNTAVNEILHALGIASYREPTKNKEEYFNEGLTHAKARRFQEALQSFNHAIALDPNDAYLYGRRANAYRALREYELALQDFDLAFTLDPASATAWAYATRGRVYDGMKNYQQALEDFERAHQLAPNDPWVNRWLGEVTTKLQRQQSQQK